MTTGKTIALTRRTFVGKVLSLLFNMLSRLVITFLPRSKHLLISWLQSPSAVILEPKKVCQNLPSRAVWNAVGRSRALEPLIKLPVTAPPPTDCVTLNTTLRFPELPYRRNAVTATRQDPRAVGRNKCGSLRSVSVCDGFPRHAGSQALLNGIVSSLFFFF